MPGIGDVARGRIRYGGDYNPEQWPPEVWPEDARLMREAGVNLATVGVFSWAMLEPRPAEYDFEWLDRVLDLLHRNDIGVCLASPTASPPPWMGHRYPQTLPRDENGTVVWYGSRNQYCPSSPVYRELACRITAELAARYADHPALRLWHVGNEYGTPCWCDRTAGHFRRWLRDRYGALEALNEAWGTAFWSQRYGSWEEILPPRRAQYLKNPAQLLDFRRFTSDALLECYTAERDILAARAPHTPVTTNFMPLFVGVDGWAWARELDVVSVDSYPDPSTGAAGGARGALVQDLTRSQAGGGPWMLMEQAAGAVNWRGVNHPKPQGLMRLWSLQAVARGADAVCFFQWRASRQGSEKFHSGMLPHAGEHSRTFRQVCELGAEFGALSRVVGSRVECEVGLLHDWDAWWATLADGRPSNRVHYEELLAAWHRALWQLNLSTGFAHPESDLSGFRMLVVPQLHLLTDAALDNLTRYVHGGGTLVCGFFTGVVDGQDRIRPGGVDARLRRLLGIRTVHEWWPLQDGESVPVAWEAAESAGPPGASGGTGEPDDIRETRETGEAAPDGSRADREAFTGTLWSEDLEPAGARPVATYTGGELAGRPAVTRHTAGAGTAWYTAVLPEPAALRALLSRAAAAAGARPVLPGLPDGVEAVRRGGLLFLLNHGRQPAAVPLPGPHADLLTGTLHEERAELDRYGVAVLREAR